MELKKCPAPKHHAMKVYKGSGGKASCILNSDCGESDWSASHSGIHLIGGWVGLTVSGCGKQKNPAHPQSLY